MPVPVADSPTKLNSLPGGSIQNTFSPILSVLEYIRPRDYSETSYPGEENI